MSFGMAVSQNDKLPKFDGWTWMKSLNWMLGHVHPILEHKVINFTSTGDGNAFFWGKLFATGGWEWPSPTGFEVCGSERWSRSQWDLTIYPLVNITYNYGEPYISFKVWEPAVPCHGNLWFPRWEPSVPTSSIWGLCRCNLWGESTIWVCLKIGYIPNEIAI